MVNKDKKFQERLKKAEKKTFIVEKKQAVVSKEYNTETWKKFGKVFVARDKQGRLKKWFIVPKDLKKKSVKELIKFDKARDTIQKRKTKTVKPVGREEVESFFRYGILVVKLIKGRTPQVLFRIGNVFFDDIFVSYNKFVALMKQEIIQATGRSIEDIIFMVQTSKFIKFSGDAGWTYRVVKNLRRKETKILKRSSIEREFEVDLTKFN